VAKLSTFLACHFHSPWCIISAASLMKARWNFPYFCFLFYTLIPSAPGNFIGNGANQGKTRGLQAYFYVLVHLQLIFSCIDHIHTSHQPPVKNEQWVIRTKAYAPVSKYFSTKHSTALKIVSNYRWKFCPVIWPIHILSRPVEYITVSSTSILLLSLRVA